MPRRLNDETCELLNMAEDLLGCALAHLEGDGYANKQVMIDYLRAYFDFKKSGRTEHHKRKPI